MRSKCLNDSIKDVIIKGISSRVKRIKLDLRLYGANCKHYDRYFRLVGHCVRSVRDAPNQYYRLVLPPILTLLSGLGVGHDLTGPY